MIRSENPINNHSVKIFLSSPTNFCTKFTPKAAKCRLNHLTPRAADAGVAGVAALPGLAPLGDPGRGCVQTPASGSNGSHHQGLATGGQLSGLQGRGS